MFDGEKQIPRDKNTNFYHKQLHKTDERSKVILLARWVSSSTYLLSSPVLFVQPMELTGGIIQNAVEGERPSLNPCSKLGFELYSPLQRL